MESSGSGTTLLKRTEAILEGGKGVSSAVFLDLLREAPKEVSPSDLNKVVTMASEQIGYWEAEYLYSPADSPYEAAAAESRGWEQVWTACSEALANCVPDVRDSLNRQQNMVVLSHHLRRRVEYNRTRPLQRFTCFVASHASFALKRIGLTSLAQTLYAYALWPAGTVGRRG